MKFQHFDIGFMTTEGADEHLFISVSDGMEHGPGIQRDGITKPRMIDPHNVPGVLNSLNVASHSWSEAPPTFTTDAFVQRAGTWTLYHHLKRFVRDHGDNWRIAGVQSNGDLTMNEWHVAFVNSGERQDVYGLRTLGSPQENLSERTYRCLVKWKEEASEVRGQTYEFLDLHFEPTPGHGWMAKLSIQDTSEDTSHPTNSSFKKLRSYNSRTRNLGPLIEFAIAGKLIVERGIELSLPNAIDRFQDIRHVFNLPEVEANGHYDGHDIDKVIFGEYQLFKNINERRAALMSPVVIDLKIEKQVTTSWEVVRDTLLSRHYRPNDAESPTRRGQFRRHSDQFVEIFFPHNVYPFGVLGIRPSDDASNNSELVGLSSGGLSGRVGNTLEGITQIMYDFFGCTDAIVLDEGFDVFSLVNPYKDGVCRYSNKELLDRVLSFTKERVDLDSSEAAKSCSEYPLGNDMKAWPLNEELMKELEQDFAKVGAKTYEDVLTVTPNRAQMRSVLIFAIKDELENRRKVPKKSAAKRRVSRSKMTS